MCREISFQPLPGRLLPPTAPQTVPVIKRIAATLCCQTLFMVQERLPQPTLAPLLSLLGRWHSHYGEGLGITADITIQAQRQFMCIALVSLDSRTIFIPVARAYYITNYAQIGQLPLQAVTKWTGFVTGVNLVSLALLLFHKLLKYFRAQTLSRLRGLTINNAYDHVRIGMHVQTKFDNLNTGDCGRVLTAVLNDVFHRTFKIARTALPSSPMSTLRGG